MLSDIKTLVEVVAKIFGARAAERDRIARLLRQISDELTDLADTWTEVSAGLSNDTQAPTFNSLLHKQRRQYQALARFAAHGREAGLLSPLSGGTGAEAFSLIEDALSEKSRAVSLLFEAKEGVAAMEKIWDPNAYTRDRLEWLRKKSDDATLPEVDRMIVRYYERNRAKILSEIDSDENERSLTRQRAVLELRSRSETMQALAGELRTVVALYESGQTS